MPSSAPPPTPAPDAADAVVLAGRYRLERRIGQGGMAEVWVATDAQLDRKVAVKWLKPTLATDSVVAERFRREAIAVARLNHPNIVAVHDVFEHDGRQAVVMQLVDGKSLRQLLDTQKRLGPELTIHIGAAVAGALDEAHRAGFVHRDVKPGNILVTSDGRVLLTDFGIAKGLDANDRDLTSDDVMMGTAKYLSPEQVRGRRLDGRADLYSLGLVLYECLAGRVPFLGQSDADTALARLQRDPTDLNRLRPTLPTGLVELIHRTLARNPAHRPATGAELRAALLRVDTTPPQIDGTPAEPPRRSGGTDVPSAGTPPARSGGAVVRTRPEPVPLLRHPDPLVAAAPRPDAAGSGRARTLPPANPRDATPPAGSPVRPRPAKAFQQRRAPSLVILGLLLLVAIVVVVGLWVTSSESPDGVVTSTIVPGSTPTSAPAATAAAPTGPVTINSVTAWDPDGDNGSENDAQAALAIDGDPATAWATECYSSKYLGGKRGVGLIVSLTDASTGRVSVSSVNAPYQLDVFAVDAAAPPTDLGAWGEPLDDTAYATEPGQVDVDVDAPARHLLVWLRELGPDEACSDANPYRGQLGEITFSP
jgi:eukaryotic-like serine/threonine-protein kinase